MSVPHWVMGHWSKLVAALRTEPVSFSQALGNLGYSNYARQSLYWSNWHDGGLGCGRGWLLPTAPHFPVSAEDTTNHRNGRTSKTYFWVRNTDTLPRKLNSQIFPFGSHSHVLTVMTPAVHRTGPGLEACGGCAGGWGCAALTQGRAGLCGPETTSSASWQHPHLGWASEHLCSGQAFGVNRVGPVLSCVLLWPQLLAQEVFAAGVGAQRLGPCRAGAVVRSSAARVRQHA